MRRYVSIRIAHGLLWVLAGLSVAACIWVFVNGPTVLPVLRFTLGIPIAIDFRLDALSTILFIMIALLAASIGRFGLRYLDGESRQWYFYKFLILTVAGACSFVLSSNLLMLLLAWLLTSFGLHRLLIFYPDRAEAVNAARKKALVSRVGDLSLLVAIAIVYLEYGSLDFESLFAAVQARNDDVAGALRPELIGLFFATGALIKSAQLPFHFWLPETMATPAPVSALMHAGIINAGGFLIIRLSPLFEGLLFAPSMLVIAGAVTSVFGALAMVTQNNIKRKLGYSTISQMGIMMFSAGLGAYAVALFHIFAHSFYKAYAFLATGNLVEETRKTGYKLRPIGPAGLIVALLATAGMAYASVSVHSGAYFAYFIYGAVLVMGLLQNTVRSPDVEYSRITVVSGVAGVLGIALALYAAIEVSLGQYLSNVAPALPSVTWPQPAAIVGFLALFLFFAGMVLTRSLMLGHSYAHRLYVWLLNGGYFSATSDRILENNTPRISRSGAGL